MKETIIIEVSQEEDGGFVAEGLTEDIFTQGDTWEELKVNVLEAVTNVEDVVLLPVESVAPNT
jgi:predicted RNase H-like HicB family nuclease